MAHRARAITVCPNALITLSLPTPWPFPPYCFLLRNGVVTLRETCLSSFMSVSLRKIGGEKKKKSIFLLNVFKAFSFSKFRIYPTF